MPVNAPAPRTEQLRHQIRTEWVAELDRLATDVERWAAADDLGTRRLSKRVQGDDVEPYDAPVVSVQTPFGRVHFNPISRFALGTEGRIEVYAEPSFAQLLLLKVGGAWQFYTEDLVPLNKSWSEQSFRDVVRELPVAP